MRLSVLGDFFWDGVCGGEKVEDVEFEPKFPPDKLTGVGLTGTGLSRFVVGEVEELLINEVGELFELELLLPLLPCEKTGIGGDGCDSGCGVGFGRKMEVVWPLGIEDDIGIGEKFPGKWGDDVDVVFGDGEDEDEDVVVVEDEFVDVDEDEDVDVIEGTGELEWFVVLPFDSVFVIDVGVDDEVKIGVGVIVDNECIEFDLLPSLNPM